MISVQPHYIQTTYPAGQREPSGVEEPAGQKLPGGAEQGALSAPAPKQNEPAGHSNPAADTDPAGQKRPPAAVQGRAGADMPSQKLPTGHVSGTVLPMGQKLPGAALHSVRPALPPTHLVTASQDCDSSRSILIM